MYRRRRQGGAVPGPEPAVHRHKITIIEPDEEQCRLLADTLDSPVICGSSVSFDTLRTAEVDSCDAFVAVTGSDEDNLVAARSQSGSLG